MYGPIITDELLHILSESLDDAEALRIATENRMRQMLRPLNEEDADGRRRGFGFTTEHPDVVRAQHLVEIAKQAESDSIKSLQRHVRTHPLYPWIKRHTGVGEKQAARLIAVIGDPYWNTKHDRPRTVKELWAYCGLAVAEGVAQRRTKGLPSNWSDTAKKRAYLIAAQSVKFPGSTYERVYREARASSVDAVHPHECKRCGPTGKPALAGSPLSDGHAHARALRKASKTILRDLWIEARDYYALADRALAA